MECERSGYTQTDIKKWHGSSWRMNWHQRIAAARRNSQVRRVRMDGEKAEEEWWTVEVLAVCVCVCEVGGSEGTWMSTEPRSRRRWEHYGWIMKRFHAVSQHHSPCMALTPKCQQAKRPSSSALPHVCTPACMHTYTPSHPRRLADYIEMQRFLWCMHITKWW